VVCSRVLEWTGNQWLANSSYWIIVKPMRILVIILAALLIRWLLHRAIRRLANSTTRASMPALLKPLKERTAPAVEEEAQFIPERRRQRAEAIGSVLRSFVTAVVFTMAALLIFGELGFNLGPLLASAGIVGVALGFGAQSLVKDFLTGMFMLMEDQYGVGDIIDAGEAKGTVEAVGLRTTRLRDVEGTVWYIPNGQINRVGNKSQEWARALLDVSVSYDTDLRQAEEIIKDVADSMWHDPEWSARLLEEPEIWGVENLGREGIDIRMGIKTRPSEQFKVMRELRTRLKERFDAEGIQTTSPQRSIWMTDGAAAEPAPASAGEGDVDQ